LRDDGRDTLVRTSKVEAPSLARSIIVRTAVPLRSVTFWNPRRASTSARTSVSMPPRNESTAAAATRASHPGSTRAPVSHCSSCSPTVPAARPNHAAGPSSPQMTDPFPRLSDARSIGNAARTLSSRESAAYIPCTSALPSVRAKVAPKRRVKNASTDSSESSAGVLARAKNSERTERRTRRPRGSVRAVRMLEGRA
jgi:hypothetical protein